MDARDRVMDRISLIKMRSSYYFKSKKVLLLSLFSASLLVSVFIVNLSIYDISAGNSLEYAGFGAGGIAVILKNLPYVLFFCVLALTGFASWLMSRLEISYNRSFAALLIILLAGSGLGGGAIFASDINETIQEKVDNENLTAPVFSPIAKKLYEKHGPRMLNSNGIVGLVAEMPAQGTREFLVKTPQGQEIKVRLLPGCKVLPQKAILASGDVIVILGEPVVDFQARGIKVIGDEARARQMLEQLKDRSFNIQFKRSPEPMMMEDFKDFQNNLEMHREFLEGMGGMLQAMPKVKNANIYFEPR